MSGINDTNWLPEQPDVVAVKIREQKERYLRAAHAMQSGVAAAMTTGSQSHEPKHLRVGVNSALVDHGALVKLLVDKGILTELEYFTAIADMMEAEVQSYERELSEHYGRPVTLG